MACLHDNPLPWTNDDPISDAYIYICMYIYIYIYIYIMYVCIYVCIYVYIYMSHQASVGGGRVTRFPFGPLNVFIYISHWAAQVNYQNRLHFEGNYENWLLTRALLDVIQLAAGRRNMIDKLLMQNWKVILLNLTFYFDEVAPAERFLYGCY